MADPVSALLTIGLTAAQMALTATQHFDGPRLDDLTVSTADPGDGRGGGRAGKLPGLSRHQLCDVRGYPARQVRQSPAAADDPGSARRCGALSLRDGRQRA